MMATNQRGDTTYECLSSIFLPARTPQSSGSIQESHTWFWDRLLEFACEDNRFQRVLSVVDLRKDDREYVDMKEITNRRRHAVLPFCLSEHSSIAILLIEKGSSTVRIGLTRGLPPCEDVFNADALVTMDMDRLTVKEFFDINGDISWKGRVVINTIRSLQEGGGRSLNSTTTKKAGQEIAETRDAPKERLVFEVLEPICDSLNAAAAADGDDDDKETTDPKEENSKKDAFNSSTILGGDPSSGGPAFVSQAVVETIVGDLFASEAGGEDRAPDDAPKSDGDDKDDISNDDDDDDDDEKASKTDGDSDNTSNDSPKIFDNDDDNADEYPDLSSVNRPFILQKKIRDVVSYKDATLPWRRSPVWTTIKFALLACVETCARISPVTVPDATLAYKSLIVRFMLFLYKKYAPSDVVDDSMKESMERKILSRLQKLGADDVDVSGVDRLVKRAERIFEVRRRFTMTKKKADQTQLPTTEEIVAAIDEGGFKALKGLPLGENKFDALSRRLGSSSSSSGLTTTAGLKDLKRRHPNESLSVAANLLKDRLNRIALNSTIVETVAALHDTETFIRELFLNVDDNSSVSPDRLLALQTAYHQALRYLPIEDLVGRSLVFLHSFALCLVLDRMAVKKNSLLMLHPLTSIDSSIDLLLNRLHLVDQEHRWLLQEVKTYLLRRLGAGSHLRPIVDEGTPDSKSPSVLLARQSSAATKCSSWVEAEREKGRQQRRAKRIEFQEKLIKIKSLRTEWSRLDRCSCQKQIIEVRKGKGKNRRLVTEEQRIGPVCRYCSIPIEITTIFIDHIEWPLPLNEHQPYENQELAIAFETIKPFPCFFALRESLVNFFVLADCVESKNLRRIESSWTSSGVGLGSTTKPFSNSHYIRERQFIRNSGVDMVIHSCGRNCVFTRGGSYLQLRSIAVEFLNKNFTFQLPLPFAVTLQRFIVGTDHTENEAIAIQSQCPPSSSSKMSRRAFVELAKLRAGARIQWRNLIAGLAMDELDLEQPVVRMFILQAINQETPEAHAEMESDASELALEVLFQLNSALDRIKTNWTLYSSFRMIVAIVNRVGEVVQSRFASEMEKFRKRCREIAVEWFSHLDHKAEGETKAIKYHIAVAGTLACSTQTPVRDHLYFMTRVAETRNPGKAVDLIEYDLWRHRLRMEARGVFSLVRSEDLDWLVNNRLGGVMATSSKKATTSSKVEKDSTTMTEMTQGTMTMTMTQATMATPETTPTTTQVTTTSSPIPTIAQGTTPSPTLTMTQATRSTPTTPTTTQGTTPSPTLTMTQVMTPSPTQTTTQVTRATTSYSRITPLGTDLNHWWRGQIANAESENENQIVVDVLLGDMLVNGAPLKQLPIGVRDSPMMKSLFGPLLGELNVVIDPEFPFQSKNIVAYRTVAPLGPDEMTIRIVVAALLKGSPIILFRRWRDDDVWEELVSCTEPSKDTRMTLNSALQKSLADNYSHWHHPRLNVIRFCPPTFPDLQSLKRSVPSKDDDWHLDLSSGQLISLRHRSRLLCKTSPLFERLCRKSHLCRLEPSLDHIFISSSSEDSDRVVRIHIERFGLQFVLKADSVVVESLDWPGYRIKADQDVGALQGFQSSLLLEDTKYSRAPELSRDEKLLVPFGKVDFNANGSSRIVLSGLLSSSSRSSSSASKSSSSSSSKTDKLRFVEYQVDRARRFEEITVPKQRDAALLLALLHLVTHRPLRINALTGETAMDSALRILTEWRLRVNDESSEEETALIEQIVSLAPKREYYPPLLKKMERITWNKNLAYSTVDLDLLPFIAVEFLGATLEPAVLARDLRRNALSLRPHRRHPLSGAPKRKLSCLQIEYDSGKAKTMYEVLALALRGGKGASTAIGKRLEEHLERVKTSPTGACLEWLCRRWQDKDDCQGLVSGTSLHNWTAFKDCWYPFIELALKSTRRETLVDTIAAGLMQSMEAIPSDSDVESLAMILALYWNANQTEKKAVADALFRGGLTQSLEGGGRDTTWVPSEDLADDDEGPKNEGAGSYGYSFHQTFQSNPLYHRDDDDDDDDDHLQNSEEADYPPPPSLGAATAYESAETMARMCILAAENISTLENSPFYRGIMVISTVEDPDVVASTMNSVWGTWFQALRTSLEPSLHYWIFNKQSFTAKSSALQSRLRDLLNMHLQAVKRSSSSSDTISATQWRFPLTLPIKVCTVINFWVSTAVRHWTRRKRLWELCQTIDRLATAGAMRLLGTSSPLPLYLLEPQSFSAVERLDSPLRPRTSGDAPYDVLKDWTRFKELRRLSPSTTPSGNIIGDDDDDHQELLQTVLPPPGSVSGCRGISRELEAGIKASLRAAAASSIVTLSPPVQPSLEDLLLELARAQTLKDELLRRYRQLEMPLLDRLLSRVGLPSSPFIVRDILSSFKRWTSIQEKFVDAWAEADYLLRLCRLRFDDHVAHLDKEMAEWGRRSAHLPRLWKVLEIELNVRIRQRQIDLAMRMIAAAEKDAKVNGMLQLNMGEGKSSVILPMLALALGEPSKTFCQVVVLQSLRETNLRDLRYVLGGALGRGVWSFRFDRQVMLDAAKLGELSTSIANCKENGGVCLMVPEHLLSLKLKMDELEMITTGSDDPRRDRATRLRLEWSQSSRTVIDECDEVLHPRFQLIYTVGASIPLEPCRWAVMAAALQVCRDVAMEMHRNFPAKVELVRSLDDDGRQDKVPTTVGEVLGLRLLEEDKEDPEAPHWRWLQLRIAQRILSRGVALSEATAIPGTAREDDAIRFTTEPYLSSSSSSSSGEDSLLASFPEDQHQVLLVLRGLLAFGVLRFVLRQRWRVKFGARPGSKIAVPFVAKDVPSPRSEFAQPDAALGFTVLHYTYRGLTLEEFRGTMRSLVQSESAERMYARWVKNLPSSASSADDGTVRSLIVKNINLSDSELMKKLHSVFRHHIPAIETYLGRIIFPAESRRFAEKLTATPWDLSPPRGDEDDARRPSTYPTIGFSGSIDSSFLYPCGTEQRETDPAAGKLLRDLVYHAAEDEIHRLPLGFAIRDIIQKARETQSDVILDVAALTLTPGGNYGVALEWLKMDDRKEYCVFADEASSSSKSAFRVVRRGGLLQPLEQSPFANGDLRDCFVFLDQYRTRGTDFKFSLKAKAIVTISRGVTRDALFQACMRMRQLGQGQRVSFVVSPEVSVEDSTSKQDCVRFCLKQTLGMIRDHLVHWSNQGTLFVKGDSREDELGDLSSLYSSSRTLHSVRSSARSSASGRLNKNSVKFARWERAIGTKLDDLIPDFERMTSLFDGEQEREQEQEQEREQEEEREVAIRESIRALVPTVSKSATVLLASKLYPSKGEDDRVLLSEAWSDGTLRKFSGHPRVFATADFVKTVDLASVRRGRREDYVAQARWVVVTSVKDADDDDDDDDDDDEGLVEMTVLSSFEANSLLESAMQLKPSDKIQLRMCVPIVFRTQQTRLIERDALALPSGASSLVSDDRMTLNLTRFNGELFYSPLGLVSGTPQEKLLDEEQRTMTPTTTPRLSSVMRRLCEARWTGQIASGFVGSDVETWILKHED